MAGSFDKTNKYYVLKFKGISYKVHRIVYQLHYDLKEDFVIDHIDNDRTNNKIENLREISHAENSRNKLRRTRPSNLPSGISLINNGLYLRAEVTHPSEISLNGRQKKKYKSIRIKGNFQEALELAVLIREQMLDELNNRFNLGYTKTHGKEQQCN